jgi:hypothetical protein
MIKELTQKQKDVMPVYVEKWIGIGTSTERLNYDRTAEIINDYQTQILCKEKVPVLIVDNPIEAWVCCCLFDLDADTKWYNVAEKMYRFFDGNPDGYDMPKPQMPYQTGSFFASLFSFYNYFIEQFGYDALSIAPALARKYEIWERTSELGMIYPIDQCVIVSQKPTVIHLNENRVLHKDGAPALEYAGRGNFKLYYLNGVKVPEYLVMTESHKLTTEQFMAEKNADVRAEFIRKFGVENLLSLGKKIDSHENYDEPFWSSSEYELWDMETLFQSHNYAPFLKMRNPTTGVWHVEGVSPKCRTLRDAIKERFGGRDFTIEAMA